MHLFSRERDFKGLNIGASPYLWEENQGMLSLTELTARSSVSRVTMTFLTLFIPFRGNIHAGGLGKIKRPVTKFFLNFHGIAMET